MKTHRRHDRYHFSAPPGFGRAARTVGRGDESMSSPGVMAAMTETEALRHQLLQAQRLSSVGELASSVAHEFNNILTTIINYAKLGTRGAENATQTQAFERILRGGQRAATIVHGMLGFARNNATRREATDLCKI